MPSLSGKRPRAVARSTTRASQLPCQPSATMRAGLREDLEGFFFSISYSSFNERWIFLFFTSQFFFSWFWDHTGLGFGRTSRQRYHFCAPSQRTTFFASRGVLLMGIWIDGANFFRNNHSQIPPPTRLTWSPWLTVLLFLLELGKWGTLNSGCIWRRRAWGEGGGPGRG